MIKARTKSSQIFIEDMEPRRCGMSCNYYRGKCLFLNGKEDGCKGCPIKKAYNKGVRDVKKDGRPHGECRTCRHRDPEDKKCDCGGLERQGCPFPVRDDYFCKFYEKGGAE